MSKRDQNHDGENHRDRWLKLVEDPGLSGKLPGTEVGPLDVGGSYVA